MGVRVRVRVRVGLRHADVVVALVVHGAVGVLGAPGHLVVLAVTISTLLDGCWMGGG